MNLPNKLSLLRIILVPFFVLAFFLPYAWSPYLSLGIFIVAALTDFLDGYIARKYNLITDLGKLLDPIADKILVCAALFCLTATNPLRLFWTDNQDVGIILFAVSGTLVLSRELLIDAVRMIAASKGKVVQANMYGKIKTTLLNVSIPVLIVTEALARMCVNIDVTNALDYKSIFTVYKVFGWIGLVVFGLGIVMTILSGTVYLVQNKNVFSEK